MLIDVSYPYIETMAIYPNNPEFKMMRVQSLEEGNGANVSLITIGTHTGTHIDAPSHFVQGGKTIDQIPLEVMNGAAKVFDLQNNAEITKDLLMKCDIEAEDIIVLRTDNSKNFRGDVVLADYVTLDYEAAEYLVERKIKMVGIDYMTIERPRGKRVAGKSVHNILLSKGIIIAEALDLAQINEGKYRLYCFPLNVVGADGVPARIALSRDGELQSCL